MCDLPCVVKSAVTNLEKILKERREVVNGYIVFFLLDFAPPCILECDATEEGMESIMMKNRHPIYFEIKMLHPLRKIFDP